MTKSHTTVPLDILLNYPDTVRSDLEGGIQNYEYKKTTQEPGDRENSYLFKRMVPRFSNPTVLAKYVS
jgi:hypothetical protein